MPASQWAWTVVIERLQRSRGLLSSGYYEQAVEQSASVLEQCMRECLSHSAKLGLPFDAYAKVVPGLQAYAERLGKNVDKFGLGELIGLYRESGLFAALERRDRQASFKEFRQERIQQVNTIRVGSYHDGEALAWATADPCVASVELMLVDLGFLAPEQLQELREAPRDIKRQTVQNLPSAPYVNFIGRAAEGEQIKGILKASNPKLWAVQVAGEGGIGKTALAYHVAESLYAEGEFESIVWFSGKLNRLSARGIATLRASAPGLPELCTAILDAFGEPIRTPRDVDVAMRRAKAHLSQQKTLLVVDNWETIQDDAITKFLEDLPGNVHLLSTSRVKVGACKVIELLPFTQQEVVSLFRSLVPPGTLALTQLANAPVLGLRMMEVTKGNPLAVTLLAAWVSEGLDFKRALSKLQEYRSGLLTFLYSELFKRMPAEAQDLLLLMAHLDRAVTKPELVHALDVAEEVVSDHLHELIKLSMALDSTNLEEPEDEFRISYTVRPLAATFAKVIIGKDKETTERIARLRIRADSLVTDAARDEFLRPTDVRSDGEAILVRQCVQALHDKNAAAKLRELAARGASPIPHAFLMRELHRDGQYTEAEREASIVMRSKLVTQPAVAELLWRMLRERVIPGAALEFIGSEEVMGRLPEVPLHKAAVFLGRSGRFALADNAYRLGLTKSLGKNKGQYGFFLVAGLDNLLGWAESTDDHAERPADLQARIASWLGEAKRMDFIPHYIVSNKERRVRRLENLQGR